MTPVTPEILQLGPMKPRLERALEDAFIVHRLWEAEDRTEFFRDLGPRIRGVVTGGGQGISPMLLESLPALEIISSFGVGYDKIDLDLCRKHGVRVANTPNVLNDAMAEFTLGLMLALGRQIPQADRYVREGLWRNNHYKLTPELTGATLGILGLGRIGKEIALRAQAFKMRIIYHGRSRQQYQPFEYYPDLVDMARAADWLVVVAPGSPATNKIVNREVLEALGPKGFLVNVARGSLVDETALLDLLESEGIGGAALDVFENEPDIDPRFLALENVVLAPHHGSATHKTRNAMADLVFENLDAHFAGRPLPSAVI